MREPLDFTPEEEAEGREFFALYGRWDPFDLDGVRDFFDGFDRPWWLVGGWAIEAFTGALREHEDMDVSLLACDVPALREFIGDRWHLWTNVSGRLRPLTDRSPDLSGAGLPDLGTARCRVPVGPGHRADPGRGRVVAEQADARSRRASRRCHVGDRRGVRWRIPRSCCCTRPQPAAGRTAVTWRGRGRCSTGGSAHGWSRRCVALSRASVACRPRHRRQREHVGEAVNRLAGDGGGRAGRRRPRRRQVDEAGIGSAGVARL